MNKSERVREYLRNNPWSTNKQIAEAVGISTADASAITTYGVLRAVPPTMERREHYPKDSRPCYEFAAAGTLNALPTGANPPVAPASAAPNGPPAGNGTAGNALGTPPASASPVPPLLQAGIEELAEQLSNIIYEKVCEKLHEKLMSIVQTKSNTSPQEFVQRLLDNIVHTKPSALIVGLLPQQSDIIQKEFGELINVKFWKEGSLQQLKKSAKGVDTVFLFTSKIGHDAKNMVNSVNSNVISIVGGMTTLRDKLTELYCGA